ncbi:hypothetical protein [Laspinema olomoucense]|uniref:Uncharacterized protein n=1 Tax=Laspinema olomoucense D3b TaxID=2953688 RepID=A0ABT2N7L0_9CYAN|nr:MULTISPECIES: hypothetical protein [unclassified Laspinema]MCT7978670.1 hypothetical protein [Laspinema sp. D3b]MCT7992334.1 hypothetical protein [Laspinema sp. D3c]
MDSETKTKVLLTTSTVFLTPDNFQVLKSAISDENLDKEIQYTGAIFLALRIYEYNLNKNSPDFQANTKKCKLPSCIDKPEIYKTDTLYIKADSLDSIPEEHKVPIDKIRLILNQAVSNQLRGPNGILYRFLAVSAMPYIRETPPQGIISILETELSTLLIVIGQFNEEEKELSNNLIQQTLSSLRLFSEYHKNLTSDIEKLVNSIGTEVSRSFISSDIRSSSLSEDIIIGGLGDKINRLICKFNNRRIY